MKSFVMSSKISNVRSLWRYGFSPAVIQSVQEDCTVASPVATTSTGPRVLSSDHSCHHFGRPAPSCRMSRAAPFLLGVCVPDRVSRRHISWSNKVVRTSTAPAKLHDKMCVRWPACLVGCEMFCASGLIVRCAALRSSVETIWTFRVDPFLPGDGGSSPSVK